MGTEEAGSRGEGHYGEETTRQRAAGGQTARCVGERDGHGGFDDGTGCRLDAALGPGSSSAAARPKLRCELFFLLCTLLRGPTASPEVGGRVRFGFWPRVNGCPSGCRGRCGENKAGRPATGQGALLRGDCRRADVGGGRDKQRTRAKMGSHSLRYCQGDRGDGGEDRGAEGYRDLRRAPAPFKLDR